MIKSFSLWDNFSLKLSQSAFIFKRSTHLFFLSLLFLLPSYVDGQTERLKTFINTHRAQLDGQSKLDSFMLQHKDMSKDSLSDCSHEIGNKWYYYRWLRIEAKENLENAILYTSQSVKLKKGLEYIDSLSIQKSLFNLGHFQRQGEFHSDALSTYRNLLNLNLYNSKTFKSFRYMSKSYIQLGDLYKARDILLQGINYISADASTNTHLANTHYDLAECYGNLGFIDFSKEILEHLELSAMAAEQSQMSDAKKYDLLIMSTHLNGNRLIKNENFQDALVPLNQNIQNIVKDDSIKLAIAHNSLGFAYFKLGKYEQAQLHYNKSILFNNSYSPPYENLGDYYLIQKEYEKGLNKYQQAISINLKSNRNLDFNLLPDLEELKLVREKNNILNHLIQKAIAWKKYHEVSKDQSHLKNSLSTFQLADKLIDEIRFQSNEDQSKLYWQKKGHSLYLNAVSLCYELNNPKLAYYFMEKNKALLLLGDVTSKNLAISGGISPEIIDLEFDIKKSIHLLEDAYARSDDSSSDPIKQNIIHTKVKLNAFQDSIYAIYPAYAIARHRVKILPYEKFIQEYTSNEKVVVHYISSDSEVYGLLNTPNQNIIFPLYPFDEFSTLLQSHLLDLRSPITDKIEFARFCKNAKKLYALLFPDEVRDLITNKIVSIIPDQKIQQLPFESLVSSIDPVTYLISNLDINYQYSISYNTMNNGLDRDPQSNFLGIAPGKFNDVKLPSLPHSKEEINSINKICNGDLLSDSEANKSNFLSQLKNYNIIHLSTHASSGDSIKPWIAFGDDKIFIDELNSTKNQAEMVTLSACNTSIGTYKNGEGAMSLARSFFYSGANSVVASLWSTNDKSSKEVMIDFYKQLDHGSTKSKSLQQAKIQYLNNNTGSALSPYYWASTIVIGNNKNIDFASPWFFDKSLLILISIVVLLFLYLKFRKKLNSITYST